jgi:type II secretion system protein N
MIQKLAGYVGMLLAFGAALLLGLYLTFPMQIVARVAEAQLEQAMGFEWDVRIRRARWAGLSGIRLEGVELRRAASDDDETPRVPTRLDRVAARVSWLSLLRRMPGGSLDIRVDRGRLWVGVTRGRDGTVEVDAHVADLPLERLTVLADTMGMAPLGQITGRVQLMLDAQLRLTDGSVQLRSEALSLREGIPKIAALERAGAFIRLPTTNLGEMVVRATIEDSNVEVTQVAASGADVNLSLQGTIELRDPMRASRVALQLRFGLDSRYVEEADLGMLLSDSPILRRSETADGYAMALTGLLGNLSPSPLPGGGARPQGP